MSCCSSVVSYSIGPVQNHFMPSGGASGSISASPLPWLSLFSCSNSLSSSS